VIYAIPTFRIMSGANWCVIYFCGDNLCSRTWSSFGVFISLCWFEDEEGEQGIEFKSSGLYLDCSLEQTRSPQNPHRICSQCHFRKDLTWLCWDFVLIHSKPQATISPQSMPLTSTSPHQSEQHRPSSGIAVNSHYKPQSFLPSLFCPDS
jgi:hypothetical protein